MVPAPGALRSPYADRAATPACGWAPVLDDALLAEVGRTLGPARLRDLLKLLAAELDTRRGIISQALADRDLHRAAHEAHSLKGAAACLGARAVAEAAQELEQLFAAPRAGCGRLPPEVLGRMNGAIARTKRALADRPCDRDWPAAII